MKRRALERDLTRLADGTLHPTRREPLERLVAGSPELQGQLAEQRRAVATARYVAQRDRAPLSLRIRHQALRPSRRAPPPPRRTRKRRLALGLVTTPAVLGSILAFVGGGGAPGLTVARAATLATRPALATVAEPPDGAVTLPGVGEDGLPFPYWQDRFGWRATGMRTDRVDGRATTTVFYARNGEAIAYTIVSGKPLTQSATVTTSGGRRIVTFSRGGHTCVLSGENVPQTELVALAS